MDLALLKCYAISMLGTPYFYGGDDPISGMDCSGLVSEILRASGIVPWNFRQSAHGIFERFQATAPWGVCELGALSFYGTDTRITHVGFCLDSETMIEAGGGGPGTDSPEEQSAQNAFARLRPVRYRSDFLCVLKPYYGRRL